MPLDAAALLAATDLRDPLLPLWAMEMMAGVFLYFWLFCLGATVGSFLNVVVYRLPRGKNLAYPGSYCPRCGHPIRLQDNIPILSWLALGGRCRDCRGTISPRYFIVELAVAAVFLLVLLAEHFLPAGALGFAIRRTLTVHDDWPFWCRYITHIVLVTTLLAAILIRADGFRVPAGLYLPVLVLGIALPLVLPEIRSVPALANGPASGWQAGLIDGLAGLTAGLAIGVPVRLAVPRVRRFAPIALCCALGVVLGWQRTILWSLPILLLSVFAARLVARIASGDDSDERQPPAPSDSSADELAPASPPENSDSP